MWRNWIVNPVLFSRCLFRFSRSSRIKNEISSDLIPSQRKYMSEKYPRSEVSQAIISCRDQSKNHTSDKRYETWSPTLLAASHWKNEKNSSGDYFTINATLKEPLTYKSFDVANFDLHSSVGLFLSKLSITQLTYVQKLIICQKLDKNLLCCAEAGVGKTLASIIFALHHVFISKLRGCIFLVCSSRLFVTEFFEKFYDLNLFPVILYNCEEDSAPLDLNQSYIFICTMEWLKENESNTLEKYHGVKFIIFDEADCCFSFDTEDFYHVRKLISSLSADDCSPHIQILSNSIPDNLAAFFQNVITQENLEYVRGQNLHCLLPQITHFFRRVTRKSKGVLFMSDLYDLQFPRRVLILCRFTNFTKVKKLLLKNNFSFSAVSH